MDIKTGQVLSSRGGSNANDFGDFYPVPVFDDDNFPAGNQLSVHAKLDGSIGGFIQLDNRSDA